MSITPITREEKFIQAIIDGSPLDVTPMTRVEKFLAVIAGAEMTPPDPITRKEKFLAGIAGADIVLPDPVTREEKYLAAIAGMEVDLPAPVTRMEKLLAEWVEASAGELKTVTGAVIAVADALRRPAIDYTATITPVQDLHGYDKPWVGGAGKNLFDAENLVDGYISGSNGGVLPQTSAYVAEVTGDFIPIESGQAYIFSLVVNNLEDKWIGIGLYNANKEFITRVGGLCGTETNISQVVGSAYTANATYARVSYRSYNNAEKMQFEKGSTATAWTSYSNICPISGHSAVNVTRTGKNVLAGMANVTDANYNYLHTQSENPELWASLRALKPHEQYRTFTDGIYVESGDPLPDAQLRIEYVNGAYVQFRYNNQTGDVLDEEISSVRTYAGVYNVAGARTYKMALYQTSGTTVGETYTPYVGETYSVEFPVLGKNLFNIADIAPYNSSVTVTKTANSFEITNGNGYQVNAFRKTGGDITYQLEDGAYTISIKESISASIGVYKSEDGVNFSWLSNGIAIGNTSATFTVNGVKYIQFRCYVPANTTITFKNFQLEKGSSATTYEPYTNTVYGGQLDVTTGVLTADYGIVDLGSLNWTWQTYSGGGFSSGSFPITAKKKFNAVCSCYPFVGSYQIATDGTISYVFDQNAYIVDSNYTSADAVQLKSDLSGQTLCYELATPITYQLTPTEIQMLLGNNTLWADTGDSTLTYWAEV